MEKKSVLILFLVIILNSNISANFEVGEPSYGIEKSYGPGENLQGWINLSFDSIYADVIFEDSFENSVKLINLLKNNSGLDYSCSTADCSPDYEISGSATTIMDFNLDANEEVFFGIKFNENLVDITSAGFVMESDAEYSCYNQLKLDLFADEIIDAGNINSREVACSQLKRYGCFDNSRQSLNYIIDKNPNKYCQKIKLSESPGFYLGADLIRGNNEGNLTMGLYTLYGEQIQGASCILPSSQNLCGIDLVIIEEKEYYVCLYSDNSKENAKIKGYEDVENGCGFYGQDFGADNAAFSIFAQGKKYDSMEAINITNNLPNGNNFGQEIKDYITSKYGSLDCSQTECIVPIRLISSVAQQATIQDLEVDYQTIAGIPTNNNIYPVTKKPAKINSDFLKIDLSKANFKLGEDYGEETYSLDLNGEEIFKDQIMIERVPLINSLYPTKTASAYPTKFIVDIKVFSGLINESTNPSQGVDYLWDFGDNTTLKTGVNYAEHTYNRKGLYDLKITIVDPSNRNTTKEFEILVDSPEAIINSSLEKMQKQLEDFKKDLDELTQDNKEVVEGRLKLSEKEADLIQLQRDYAKAQTEQELNLIMGEILKMKVPKSLELIKKGSNIEFYPKSSNINLNYLTEITGEEYEFARERAYQESILFWMQENSDIKMTFKNYKITHSSEESEDIKIFDLIIDEKGGLNGTAYIIIGNSGDLEFNGNYGEINEEDFSYIEFNGDTSIEFLTNSELEFSELPIFISPNLNKLSLIENFDYDNEEKDPLRKWIMFSLVLFLILVGGFIAYIILQEWYKKKYEDYLFQDRNNLFNILNYIATSKNKNKEDKEIESELKKAGWNPEQVTYAMRKYYGKRTGMWEIPITNVIKKFKKESEKNQPIRNTPPKNMFPNQNRFSPKSQTYNKI
ncbi:PKD domain-containing protein [Candidatus Babeliales bacterium]|nr:PKD domain-containing protein [Candidatus Babeliales bacterium]MCF7910746.1 PKD domain-containing protein [Candidatus Pacearchaeota archaeon]